VISPGAPLAVLVDLESAWLKRVTCPSRTSAASGSASRPSSPPTTARPGNGTVSFIAPEAEFTPKNVQTRDERVKLVYRIKIALREQDGMFKPGMPAEAVLEGPAGATEGAPATVEGK
jgi:HlyD family secretion protein